MICLPRSLREAGWRAFLAFSLAFLTSTSCGGESAGTVVLLGIDGLDPVAVDQMIAAGELPNLARLRASGSSGTLVADPPLLSPILWTTIATGRPAREHGIGHFVTLDPTTGEEVPVTSSLRKTEALWSIASGQGREVAVVGWWATWPPEPVRGTVVSDHAGYHFLFAQAGRENVASNAIAPPEEARRLARMMRRPDTLQADELAGFARIPIGEWQRPFEFDDEVSHLKWAYATADGYRRIALDLLQRRKPDLTMVYIEATDSVSHLFGHLHGGIDLAGELLKQQRRFGGTVSAMYQFADRIVGEVLAAMPEGATLIVLSDHGFRLGELPDDPTSRSGARLTVDDSFHRREGVLFLYGGGVRSGTKLAPSSQLDIAPTVLALLGLEVPRDMPGRVLSEALAAPPSNRQRETYETGRVGRVVESPERVAEQSRSRLEALGYLARSPDRADTGARAATVSAQSEINLAAVAVNEGRYREAIATYRDLLRRFPDEVRLFVSLAAAYSGDEQFARAEEILEAALRLAPADPRAHYNKGMVAELQGKLDAATTSYRTALEYSPEFEAARQALLRLGHADDGPLTAAERQALALCDEAREFAKRGDYERAAEAVERAFELAPRSATVLQYRSNVAYLRGDVDMAIKSLEAALQIEPSNLLFQKNLRRLRER